MAKTRLTRVGWKILQLLDNGSDLGGRRPKVLDVKASSMYNVPIPLGSETMIRVIFGDFTLRYEHLSPLLALFLIFYVCK